MKRLLLLTMALMTATASFAQDKPTSSQSVRVVPVPEPGRELNVRIWTDRDEYRIGEEIKIYYRTNRDAYVLIFSETPDGETRQLLPNAYDDDNFVRGGETYTIPNRGYRLEVTPPRGREKLSIVAFSERNRTLDGYRARKSEVFPKSEGPRAAIARVEPRPEDGRGRRYAEDSKTIRITGGWDNGGGWDDGYWDDDRGDSRYGRMRIDSDPGGAYVYINGMYRGVTPLDLGQVKTGNYDITLYRPGYYQVRKRVRVEPGERERVDEDLRLIRYR